MRIIYNGVDLMPLETYAFDCEEVLDPSGVDYLYTKVSGIHRSVVNGLANLSVGPPMSYSFSGLPNSPEAGPRAFPKYVPSDFVPGTDTINVPDDAGIDASTPVPLRSMIITPNPAPLTHAAIRHRLQVPRGQLWVFSGPGMESGSPAAGSSDPPSGRLNVLMMRSPQLDDSICDCKNGPFPKVFAIHTALGDSTTFFVDWAFETYINESSINGAGDGILLSHRFSQVHNIPVDGYTSMTTTGLAIFRTDAVYKLETSPDSYRPFLFMPIPQGFIREINYVRGREDVTGVEYSYTDTQVPVNFPAGPYAAAATISVHHRQAIVSNFDVWGSALTAYERVLGIKANKAIGEAATADVAKMEERGRIRSATPGSSKGPFKFPPPPAGTTTVPHPGH